MIPQDKCKIIECKYRAPWLIIHGDLLIGQTCWHPANLDEEGRIHLLSKSCEEWAGNCPAMRKSTVKSTA